MIVSAASIFALHGQPVWAYLIAGAVSFAICLLLVRTAQKHVGLTSRASDLLAVQASHKRPTPRIGGVAIFIGLELAVGFMAGSAVGLMTQVLLAAVPVMVAGLLEDMGRELRPMLRLMAAALSAVMAMHLTGAMIHRVDVPVVDALLGLMPVALVFTTFAVAGMCNAMNLVDGMNGLAGTLAIIGATGLALLSAAHGQQDIAAIAAALTAVILGFLALNYPHGRIFLGDAGAYLIGFVLAWLAVLLMQREPGISPWALVLIMFWPLADTLLAIYRRRSNGRPTDLPDRLHFHQLVKRTLEILLLGRHRWALSNPLVTVVVAPVAVGPMLAGVWLAHRPGAAALTVLISGAVFFAGYRLLLVLARRRPRLAGLGTPRRADSGAAGLLHGGAAKRGI